MNHPFLNYLDIAEESIEDIQSKISDIIGKLQFAANTGNVQLSSQLRMALETYQEALQYKLREIGNTNDNTHNDMIDIK